MSIFSVIDPATGILEANYPETSDAQLEQAINRASSSTTPWAARPVLERATVLATMAQLLTADRDRLASIITREMGKLRAEALFEVDLCAEIFNYYADNAETLTADTPLPGRGASAVIQKRAIGALLGIMPWNYPYYQLARFAAPNLLLGNTILLKPAPRCPESALAIEALLVQAGLPAECYSTVLLTNEQIAAVVEDPRIQGVSLTGSERAGEAVGALAGANLKRSVLELGGSDVFIVLDDGDTLALAADAAVSRLENAGQACDSPKRIIVAATVFESFVAEVTRLFAELVPGNPNEPTTSIAPMASAEAVDALIDQIRDALDLGAILHTGGSRGSGPGSTMQPTVLTGVTPPMRAYHEELFGPVAVIYSVDSDEQAIALANDSAFGLGARVHSLDLARATAVADRLEVGMVGINVPADASPDLPFGGIKRSGIGRELGPLGIEEFANKKLVRQPVQKV